MALAYADRVAETTTTTGTGTYNLGGAQTGFQGFVAGVGTGNTCYYFVTDGTDWEVGLGTVTDASPDTLSRDSILASSNSNAAVNWGAGTKDVVLTAPASQISKLTNSVDKTGTPADNQIAVFTDADTVEGTSGLTYNGTTLSVTGTVSASTAVAVSTASFDAAAGFFSIYSSSSSVGRFNLSAVHLLGATAFLFAETSGGRSQTRLNTTKNHWVIDSAGNLVQLGDRSATPAAYTFQGQLGSGTNINGGDLTVGGGPGTGSGTGGWTNIASAPAGSSGTTAGTLVNRVRVGPTGGLTLVELSADPADPAEGQSVLWQSDGTGAGDDGDIMLKITAGGVTKTTTLVDFSALP